MWLKLKRSIFEMKKTKILKCFLLFSPFFGIALILGFFSKNTNLGMTELEAIHKENVLNISVLIWNNREDDYFTENVSVRFFYVFFSVDQVYGRDFERFSTVFNEEERNLIKNAWQVIQKTDWFKAYSEMLPNPKNEMQIFDF